MLSKISGDKIHRKSIGMFRYKQYSANDLEKAVEDCKAGMPYLAVSRKYNIPRTTISDNVRKNNFDFKKPSERTYSAHDLEKAVQESKAGMSTAELSRKYNIPRTTIFNNVERNIKTTSPLDSTTRSCYNLNESSQNIKKRQMEDDDIHRKCRKLQEYKTYTPYDSESLAGAPIKELSTTLYQEKNIATMNTKDMKSEIRKSEPSIFGYKKYSASVLYNSVQANIPGTSANELPINANIPKTIIYAQRQRNIATMNTKDMISEISKTQPSSSGYKKCSGSNLGSSVEASIHGKYTNEISTKCGAPKETIYRHEPKKMIIAENIKTREMIDDVNRNRWPNSSRPTREYSANDLDNALESSKGGMTVRESSRKYNVPYSTLYYRKSEMEKTKPNKNGEGPFWRGCD